MVIWQRIVDEILGAIAALFGVKTPPPPEEPPKTSVPDDEDARP